MITISIIIIILLLITSGLCRSLVHTLLHHYPEFKAKWKIKNDEFWNPAVSWRKKYKTNKQGEFLRDKEGNLVRKSGLIIPLYDAFHRFNTIELICDHLVQGILAGLIFWLIFNPGFGWLILITLAGTIIAGLIKVLISFNIGYDKLWR